MTYALGSCIALLIHDPQACVGGLLHFMLPESKIDARKAQMNPSMFADTGIPMLFHRAYELGAVKSRLVVRAAGAAQVEADERLRSIPVLVVSTDCSDHRIQQMLALGAKGYLPKPFTPEALREKLECLLGAAYV